MIHEFFGPTDEFLPVIGVNSLQRRKFSRVTDVKNVLGGIRLLRVIGLWTSMRKNGILSALGMTNMGIDRHD